MREDATTAWGAHGVAVGSGNATAPVAVAFDSPSSFVLFERAAGVGGDRLLAFRYATRDAESLWEATVDLGPAAGPARTTAASVGAGLIRVDRGGARRSMADVASDGGVSVDGRSGVAKGR
jgi:hypothetical protein